MLTLQQSHYPTVPDLSDPRRAEFASKMKSKRHISSTSPPTTTENTTAGHEVVLSGPYNGRTAGEAHSQQKQSAVTESDKLVKSLTLFQVWVRRFACLLCLVASLTLMALFVLYLGMVYEQSLVRALPSTEQLYKSPKVCALHYNDTAVDISTVANASLVEQEIATAFSQDSPSTIFVAHCGECGQCSTPHDISIYDQTQDTLFETSLACAKHGVIGSYEKASKCMLKRVGLSSGCNKCWVDNMMCSKRHCSFSCAFQALFYGGIRVDSSDNKLNRCTSCDEVRCGPAFLECAGANRRRSAIASDIIRDSDQVCSDVRTRWWLDEELQTIWQREYGINTSTNEQTPADRNSFRGRRDRQL